MQKTYYAIMINIDFLIQPSSSFRDFTVCLLKVHSTSFWLNTSKLNLVFLILNSLLPDRFLPRVIFFCLFHPLDEVHILKAKEGVVLFVECQVWHIPMNLLKKIRLSPRVRILYFQVYVMH